MEHYIYKNRQKLRCGYTTGSCAAAAAKAAAVMLLCQSSLKKIDLMTPKGILLHLDLHDVQITSSNVTCAVKKDSGDDPDITNGVLVYATVEKQTEPTISLKGGIGVGTVTKAGLEQPIGRYQPRSAPNDKTGIGTNQRGFRLYGRFLCNHIHSKRRGTGTKNV